MTRSVTYWLLVLTGWLTTTSVSAQTWIKQVEKGLSFLSTNRLTIGGENGKFEWGPITQSVSYNDMEGLRLKAGGNTTLQLNNHFLLRGYLAYGVKDEQFKYRGDLLYSLSPKKQSIWEFPKRLFTVSYIHDLNIPGQDLQTSRRDELLLSFAHSAIQNMSLQKLATIAYEHELKNHLSFRMGGKYLYDEPKGSVQYLEWVRLTQPLRHVRSISVSELDFSLRYAPKEIFLQKRDKRLYILPAIIELNVRHRIGFKGVLGSEYRYHITDAGAGKRIYLPKKSGITDIQLSAGKVWSRVPFPLLFIPAGNQSYIFDENDYNQMQFYEFTTDRFVAGRVDFRFNWSPFNLLYQSYVKTTLGIKAIYGPLSDYNNPALHSGLFLLSNGVKPLDNNPYVEMHIGLDNILDFLRVEWVQRLTYFGKGSIFVSSRFAF